MSTTAGSGVRNGYTCSRIGPLTPASQPMRSMDLRWKLMPQIAENGKLLPRNFGAFACNHLIVIISPLCEYASDEQKKKLDTNVVFDNVRNY
jgi:hypothetical protein